MNEPNSIQQIFSAAIDAVMEQQKGGELIANRKPRFACVLRQRIIDLQNLNQNNSASTIASALTKKGFKVSASTVQRVLQESSGTKRKRKSDSPQSKISTLPQAQAPQASASVASSGRTAPTQPTPPDAKTLLDRIQKEVGMQSSMNQTKRVATL